MKTKYRVGKTISVKNVDTVSQKIIDNQRDVQVGLDRVNGIIHNTVHIEVKNTGSNLVLTASIILSLKGISSFILAFILSKSIIQFLTTIQNNATSHISHGNESGCQKITNQINTHIRERGIVERTKTDCLYESKSITKVAIMKNIQNTIATRRLCTDFWFSSFAHHTSNSYQWGSL